MVDVVLVAGLVIYGWAMYSLGSWDGVEKSGKAKVCETSDEDPRVQTDDLESGYVPARFRQGTRCQCRDYTDSKKVHE